MTPPDSIDLQDALGAMFGQTDDPTTHRLIGTGGLGLPEDVVILVAHDRQWEYQGDDPPPCPVCGVDFW